MKQVKLTIIRNYRDSKFSYPKVKRNKKIDQQLQENKENMRQNSSDFWEDCKK